jgi:hypothetical protein
MTAPQIVQTMFLSAATLRGTLERPQKVYTLPRVGKQMALLLKEAPHAERVAVVRALGNAPVHAATTEEQMVAVMVTHFHRMVVYGKRPDGKPYRWTA